jgi:SMODS-associated and fused to various effectors sensor domain
MPKSIKVTKKNIEPTSSPVQSISRSNLKTGLVEALVATTAGRCEFRGCNDFLFIHHVTHQTGNFSEKAHIVAYKENGPRGLEGPRPQDINSIDNLMLICARCHKLIDDFPLLYPRSELELQKKDHEDRIKRVSELGPELQTFGLIFKSKIGSLTTEISTGEIFKAVHPRYHSPNSLIMNFNNFGDEASDSYEFTAQRIKRDVAQLYATHSELITKIKHLSVFGLGPIPLLVTLGNCLSNTVSTDFYQCHRDQPDRWMWQNGGDLAQFKAELIRSGDNKKNVALLLSLSGKISLTTLPSSLDASYFVYEITLANKVPHVEFLRQRQDLENFRMEYRGFLSKLRANHPAVEEIHVFPAIPTPIAITCGFDLLPKVDPVLVVYDNNKSEGGFVPRLKVNTHEQ